MKGKMTIVLLSLVLVFGMIAASCDDGAYSDNPYKNDPNKSARDWIRSPMVPKIALPAVNLSTYLTAIGTFSSSSPGALAGTPLETFVGGSTLAVASVGGPVTITSANSWGGGMDVKIGTGTNKIDLKPDATITVKTSSTGATGSWVLRLKTNDYSGGTDTPITPGTDVTVKLSAADIDKILGSDTGAIRINTSATGNAITVTDIVFTNYQYAD